MSKKSKIIVAIIVAILLLGGIGAYFLVYKDKNSNKVNVKTSQQEPTQNLVGTLGEYEDFSELSKALEQSGISTTLEGEGPYTVLAANNLAFKALPEDTLQMLLKPENQSKLTDILNYNIVPVSIITSELTNGQLIKTLQGQEVKVELTDGNVYFIDAKGQKALVVNKDLKATNGTIQEINVLLLPQ